MDKKMNEVMKGIYENLTDEQKAKVKDCKTMDEFMALAGEWGIDLPDDVLDAVAGGKDIWPGLLSIRALQDYYS